MKVISTDLFVLEKKGKGGLLTARKDILLCLLDSTGRSTLRLQKGKYLKIGGGTEVCAFTDEGENLEVEHVHLLLRAKKGEPSVNVII